MASPHPRRKNGGKPPATPRPNRVPTCNLFATTGKCSYRNCKFSHERSGPGPATPETPRSQSRPRAEGSGVGSQNPGTKRTPDPHHRWRRFLRSGGQGGQPSSLSPAQVEQFLTDAIAVLDESNPGPKQDLLKELGTEAGVERIRQLTEANYVTYYTVQNFSFKTHCVPFLQLLSHAELRSSLVAEKAVGTIYNVVYGVSGRRAIQFFTSVAENLQTIHAELDINGGPEFFQIALPAATSTLFNTLDMNQSATVQPEFKTIVNSLSDCLNLIPNKADFSFRSADNDIHRLKEILKMADSLPATYIPQPATYTTAANYANQMILDLPGNLSDEGVRHDNDHENITEIKILPTVSEISCPRDDFLPLKSPDSTHHLTGLPRIIDSQFRLLRADTSGKIKETIQEIYKRWDEFTKPEDKKSAKRTNRSGLFTRTATNPALKSINQNRGLEINVTFDQPKRAKKLNNKERQDFWKKFKFLQEGTLLCILDDMHRCVFFTVVRRSVEPYKKKDRDMTDGQQEEQVVGTGEKEVNDLAGNADRALITLRFAENPTYNDIATLTDWAHGSNVCLLVEFSSVLFVAFEPILRCLQAISKSIGNVPFSKWISPNPNYAYQTSFHGFDTPEVDVPPPLYLSKPNMTLDLSSITKNKQPLYFSAQRPLGIEELEKRTTLDHGQCAAVITSFTRELALIQGPPGTGKSYVGDQIVKVLLANSNQTKIGPIVCVCYTNHALDQFLEHILETTDKVIRLGGKSKSEVLQKRTLHAIAAEVSTTFTERNAVRDAHDKLRGIEKDLESVCKNIFRDGQKSLASYLEEYHLEYHRQLFGDNEEGFEIVRSKDDSKVIDNWVNGRGMVDRWRRPPRSNREIARILQVDDIFSLSLAERGKLKQHWEAEKKTREQEELVQVISQYTTARDDLNTQYASRDLRILQDAHVIGVTTTGLAKHSNMLRSLRSKVLIVEEAAEVLEAHLLTAFLPTLEHAILIGDHLQLRPQISSYELSMESGVGKNYGLDESLFERLTNERYNGARFPFAKLDTQRRMYPTISSLIRNTLYPELRDHRETQTHLEVPGMAHRLFWFDHRCLESGAGGIEEATTSHTNLFEVEFVVALVRHLTRQGVYKQKDIAVLTPYLGQLNLLRKELNSMVEVIIADKDQEVLDQEDDDEENDIWGKQTAYSGVGQELRKGNLGQEVKIATVDNFQGEEAKVIIISLVRSNEQRKCGFLKTSNRINVLLSRARDGMYIIGNAQTSGGIKMWSDVIGEMERNRNIGPHLELRCSRHPDKRVFVSSADDFARHAPEGGCDEQCGLRLNCGHPCKQKCHSKNLHLTVSCTEPCQRSFENCSHPCPKMCGADCGRCMVIIGSVGLPCGHIRKGLRCHESQDLRKVYCREKVTRLVPLCGHEGTMDCSEDISKFRCRKQCGDILPCGHACGHACSSCKKKKGTDTELVVNHRTCKQPCGRNYTTCKHTCRQPCHDNMPCNLCEQPCEVRCNHSRCGKKCSEPCAPCPERCSWTCIHREPCQMPCAVPCDIIPCSKRCENTLDCGHQCPSVCGETCPPPEICQKCAAKDKLERPVDYITFETYADINLDEDPIIYLSCGHFFTVGTLDGLMDMNDAYHIDPITGNILGPKPLSEASKTKSCPDCRQPLLDIYRYNRVVKSSFLSESTKRFCAFAHDAYLKLYQEVSDAESILESNRDTFLSGLNRELPTQHFNAIQGRLRSYTPLIRSVETFIDFAAEAEQPYAKVYRMVIDAKNRRGIKSSFRLDNSAVQLSFHLKGLALYLRLKWAMHWDAHKITDSTQVNESLRATLRINTDKEISTLRPRCLQLRNLSQDTNSIAYEIEARIYQAQFTALQLLHISAISSTTRPPEIEAIITSELESLSECSQLVERHPGTAGKYREEIEKSRVLLNGGTFYTFVSDEEKRAIYQAMAATMRGTGHWYTCENGHLFTVGECGMPMQLATCNECGARVGGQNHNPTEGVRAAGDFETQFRNMRI